MEQRSNREDKLMLALACLSAACLLVVPLAVLPDTIDRFRVIKESISRAEGILGLFLLAVGLAFAGSGRFREMLRERAVAGILAAGIVWAVVATLASTHRGHSTESLITFLTCVLVFVTTWYAAPRIPLLVVDLLVIPALANVVLVALQEYAIYQPFRTTPGLSRHMSSTGLIGNPNIVGSYFALLAIVFTVSAMYAQGGRRWWQAFGALTAIAGIVVSQTRTAVVALIAGLLLLAIGRSVKRASFAAAAIVALIGIGIALELPAITRLLALPRAVARHGLSVATSGRVAPALAGLEMAYEHPLTGVGPGAYKYQYMPYKVQVRKKFGGLMGKAVENNFGEAHNDHVQILAETGVAGYLLFLGTVIVVVQVVRRGDRVDVRSRIAAYAALPLAGSLLVLCLAQFPLYVPVTRHLLFTMAGLLLGWSRSSA